MKKIRRRCKCGCGGITNYGGMYIRGHTWRGKKFSVEHRKNLSLAQQGNTNTLGYKHTTEFKRKISLAQFGKKLPEETKRRISLALQGRKLSERHKRKISKMLRGNTNTLGKKHSVETKLKMSLSQIKYDPNYPYCDVWKDEEYKKDIRKDHCENADCKKTSKRLHNHHIHLDKKRCEPNDIMTLCNSCHIVLHNRLRRGTRIPADPKDFIIINRSDHVSYIHKKSRTIIKIRRRKY